MSRMTIELSENIAKKMTEKKSVKIKELEKEISNKVRVEVLKKIPKEIKALFEKHPNFFRKESSVQVNGNGFNFEWISIDAIPSTNETRYLSATIEFANEVKPMIDKLDKLKKQKKELVLSIENALRQLRTFKNVRTEFPQAAAFLPSEDKVYLPSINLDEIKKQLID